MGNAHNSQGNYAEALRHARGAIRLYQEQLFAPEVQWAKMRSEPWLFLLAMSMALGIITVFIMQSMLGGSV